MLSKKEKVYIVLVNHNGYLDTIECLESIMKQRYSTFQAIVVDNSKTDSSLKQISKWSTGQYNEKVTTQFPEIIYPPSTKPISSVIVYEKDFFDKEFTERLILVKALQNNGFAAANNIALRYIQKFGSMEDLIWLLNNDTMISKGTMQDIINKVNTYNEDKHRTLFGTPLLEYYEPKKIQAVGGKYNIFFGLTSHIGEGLDYNNMINVNQFKVDYPMGASMLITKFFLKKVGLLNEEYFLFFEEIDWALRAEKQGYEVKILDIYSVYHKQGESTKNKYKNKGLKNEFIDLTYTRSRIAFAKNFYKKYTYLVAFSILTLTVVNRIRKGGLKRATKIFKMTIKEMF